MRTIYTFICSQFNSNTYVICSNINNEVLIIDPGDSDSIQLLDFLRVNEKKLKYVILTHEHFDHISGLNTLKENYDFQLIGSEFCLKNINNPSITLSKYVQCGFIKPNRLLFEDVYIVKKDIKKVKFGDNFYDFILTPGHSEGGMCIKWKNILFTGDTVLEDTKLITKFPGGDNIILKDSLKKIELIIKHYLFIYPGHGLPYKKYKLN